MTDQQIKERCEKFVQQKFIDNDNPLTPHGHVIELESLYREAMAAGLERAMKEASSREFGDDDDFVWWCDKEAQRLKEGGA